ncbi:MAG: hypothetical protein BWY42_00788 [Candidatus Omnitrophica bacterium ADurb.Bin277]|nr:MAG: hypothetical protein BWY42_00788 [Candidatus Omnitrophica bacterium ADurb.Bin277]
MRRVVFLGFWVLTFTMTFRAEAAPALRTSSPPSHARVNAPFSYEIRLEWPAAEGNYEVLPVIPTFENLNVIRQIQSQETVGSLSSVTLRYELAGVKKGPARIGSMDLRYRFPDENEWRILPVPGTTVEIRGTPLWQWILVAGSFGAMFAVLARFARKKWLNRQEARKESRLLPPNPHQRIYAKAEESIVTYKGENQPATISFWTNELKKVVRTYYDIPQASSTEAEILELLASKNLPAGEFTEISSIFSRVETAKYAGRTLTLVEMETLQKTLLQYVRGKIIIGNPSNG